MPPRIYRVRWSARNLPWGISFDEQTGTFSGTPEDVGDFEVPVMVETNYGASKEEIVTISINKAPATVYAIGARALSWSNNAEPDAQGLYQLPIMQSNKLMARHDGFIARAKNGSIYYTGIYDLLSASYSPSTNGFQRHNNILNVNYSELPAQMLCGRVNGNSASSGTTKDVAYTLALSYNGSITFQTGGMYTYNGSQANYINTRADGSTFSDKNNYKLPEAGWQTHSNFKKGISWLAYNGEVVRTYTITNSANEHKFTKSEKELDYRAVKIFAPTNGANLPFNYLSENKYLDNDPSKFKIGVIKDAWCYGSTCYVQTENNNIYEYTNSSWLLRGNYDVKKFEIPAAGIALLLTNDGRLLHKGSSIAGITDEHTNFTEIFSGSVFDDFTISSNYQSLNKRTLVVLKED